jgi:hypothetical protein
VISKIFFLCNIYRLTKVMYLTLAMDKHNSVYKESCKIIVAECGWTNARNKLPIRVYLLSVGNKPFVTVVYAYHSL